MGTPERFDAFISYAHEDEGRVRHLHEALERRFLARVPRALRSGRRELRIARDRSEFQAGAGLSREVEDHLDASNVLLVMCTPASVRSGWVGLEIRRFMGNAEGKRSVIPVVLHAHGSLGADAWPPALRDGEERLSVDARAVDERAPVPPEILLQIYAPIVGVRYSVLSGRHARWRRQRAVLRGAGALAAVGLIGAALYETAVPVLLPDDSRSRAPLRPSFSPALACGEHGGAAVGGEDGHVGIAEPGGRVLDVPLFSEGLIGSLARDGDVYAATSLSSSEIRWVDLHGQPMSDRVRHPEGIDWVRVVGGARPGESFAGDDDGGVWSVRRGAPPERIFAMPGGTGERIEALAWDGELGELVALDAGGQLATLRWGRAVDAEFRRIAGMSLAMGLVVARGDRFVLGFFDGDEHALVRLRRGSDAIEVLTRLPRSTFDLHPGVDGRSFLLIRKSGEVGVWDAHTGTQVDLKSFRPGVVAISQTGVAVGSDRASRRYCVVDADGLHGLRPGLRSALGFHLPVP